MRNKFNALLLIVGLITGCRVYRNSGISYDKSVDFNSYHTFAILPDTDSANTTYNNKVIRNTTMNYFTHCMGEFGLKANIDTPDVLIHLQLTSIIKQRQLSPAAAFHFKTYYQSNPYYNPFPNPYYYNSVSYYLGHRFATEKVDYSESTITLNVIDRKLDKVVWSGTAKGDLYDSTYLQFNLHPAVYEILKKYPVKPINKHNKSQIKFK